MSARGSTSRQAPDVLAPLSALQPLTSLQLDSLQWRQLRHLQLPQLSELSMCVEQGEQGTQLQLQLQLGHLTNLSKLEMVLDGAASMQIEDQLPPHLQEVDLTVVGDERCSLQPLLWLRRLRQLHLKFSGIPEASKEAVRQLSSLISLQDLHLYCWQLALPRLRPLLETRFHFCMGFEAGQSTGTSSSTCVADAATEVTVVEQQRPA
ncbi:hypothetical protein COO60DRAFT_282891 [Scenedesmus sp. NREL 46B-D3]|nr:hypothetical protein COO60DRAFT_282891 [Scenedesmus sp. NREL 46B-D3]